MYILHIISFLMIALSAGYLLKARLSDMLPFVWCGLVLVLYVLSFGRMLNLIDFVMPIGAVILFAYAAYVSHRNIGASVQSAGPSGRVTLLAYFPAEITSVAMLVYAFLALGIVIGVSSKTVTWWDDINYWASDLKSLYYLNGFASKYANVSPQFGDYPPGVQLAKWYLVHMDPKTFKEGLAFAGYYLFNFSFAMPLFARTDKKMTYLAIPLAIVTWFIPGIADKYGYAGFCADLSMAFIFGNILISAADKREEAPEFEKIRIMLYLAVLVICKSTGAIWALFGIIIWVGCRLSSFEKFRIKNLLRYWWVVASPFIVGASWMLFCFYKRRVTNTTATMVTYITTDKYGLSEYTGQFAKAFAKAFFTQPLHVDRTWIDISPAIMLIVLIAAFVFLYRYGYMANRAGKFMCVSLPVMGVIYYGVIFVAHITIFATETQYLEASAMIASIERYGVPFMLGSILFIFWLWLCAPGASRIGDYRRLGIWVLAVILLTNIPAAYKGLIGYRNTLDEENAIRQEMVDEESHLFLEEIGRKLPDGNARVCRLRDGGYYRVADTYVAYEASPVSTMCISYDLSQTDAGTIIMALNQTHAVFFYADMQENVIGSCLDEMVKDGDFEYRSLYYVSYEDGGMVLYPVR